MWGVIAIIILVLLLFGSILEQNDLKHQLEVKHTKISYEEIYDDRFFHSYFL